MSVGVGASPKAAVPQTLTVVNGFRLVCRSVLSLRSRSRRRSSVPPKAHLSVPPEALSRRQTVQSRYPQSNESYVEIVRNRTRMKIAVATEVAAKERKSQPTEARHQTLQKRLAEEVEKRRHSEQICECLQEDVESVKCASVDLLNRLESCRTAYDAESLKVDELLAAAEKEQEYQIESTVRAKKLTEYEAARILDLEFIEKLET
ncbi:hypothetical protein AXG93_3104s1120 [Marchantia polymorpha subsp. ruderalis]|uniref:Uncharacterized protein n=1 Tax=Marchantia polymorpha subsp. ruderalis TaxID=1480154 RepID=A0A176WRX9_MARPO|nr:hypothetical protein AXG93_3104s1120 [Marchantia polymorpha subsp. ruderalis]